MSAHTDRIGNQNLIELAKKQYELDKRKSIPSEIIKLASKGKVYPKDHPLRTGTIEMRYMTAYDEDILTNPSYMREGVVLDKLLEALIITPIDYSTLTLLDKNSLIISARILSYGKDYPVLVNDPKTGKQLERIVDLSKLNNSDLTLDSDDNGEFLYTTKDGTVLKFKFLLIADTNNLSVSEFLERTITQVNDSRKLDDIKDFIRYKFLAIDSKKFREFIEENTPTLDMDYEFEGEDGSTFISRFPIGADLFWF
jgi:hypothetical protein